MKLTPNWWHESLLIGAILLTPLLIFIPSLNQIPFPVNSQFSDLVISHLPNIIEVRNSLTAYQQIPLWSETILGGYPFISDPLSSIWYPPLWITWFLPIPFSINLLVILHLFFAEMGMYLFLVKKGIGAIPALIGALIIGLAPKIWGHFALGHITLIFALAWTPWLLCVIAEAHALKGLLRLTPGLVLGFIILADIRWFVYAGFIFFFYGLYNALLGDMSINNGGRLWGWGKNAAINLLTALLICLPFLLMVFQYSLLSTRNLMTLADQLNLSLPPEGLFGIFFPDMAGNGEWITYTGALTLVILIQLLFTRRDKESYFWAGMFLVSLYFATGPRPLMDFLLKLPGMNLLRVPSRSIFVSIFAVSFLTAKGCDLIVKESKDIRVTNSFWFNLVTFGIGIFSTLLVVGMTFFVKSILIKFTWGAAFYVAFFILLNLRDRQMLSGKAWGIVILPIIVLDLLTVGHSQLRYENYDEVINQQIKVVNLILGNGKEGRIYSPSYSIPQQTSAYNHLEMVDGINPLQLANYADYMSQATGVPYIAYGVTIPPFQNGKPETDNQFSQPNLDLLGKLNVRYIVSEFEIFNSGLEKLAIIGKTQIYENLKYRPLVYIQGGRNDSAMILTKHQSGLLELSASGPGELVISEVYYPGWNVFVDGVKKDIVVQSQIFQSVNLEPGNHHILFKFTPDLVLYGLFALFLIGIGFVGVKIAHP